MSSASALFLHGRFAELGEFLALGGPFNEFKGCHLPFERGLGAGLVAQASLFGEDAGTLDALGETAKKREATLATGLLDFHVYVRG